jgi:hypothetical protein
MRPRADENAREPSPPTSPLAQTTPPPISLATLRNMARKPGASLPIGMLEAMRLQLETQGRHECVAELESLFDFATGLAKAR